VSSLFCIICASNSAQHLMFSSVSFARFEFQTANTALVTFTDVVVALFRVLAACVVVALFEGLATHSVSEHQLSECVLHISS
jgi:hypothetical protein